MWFHLVAGRRARRCTSLLLVVRGRRGIAQRGRLARPASLLSGWSVVQLALGAATWVVKYGWPAWLAELRISQPTSPFEAAAWLQAHRHHGARGHRLADSGDVGRCWRCDAHGLLLAPQRSCARRTRDDWQWPHGGARMSTSTSRSPIARAARGWLARSRDYVELTKPRIVVLELVTVAVARIASPRGASRSLRAVDHTCWWARCWSPPAPARSINGSERDTDARMARTADRPLPAGRLSRREVLVFRQRDARRRRGCIWPVPSDCRPPAWALATWVIYVWRLHAAQDAHRRSTRPSARWPARCRS